MRRINWLAVAFLFIVLALFAGCGLDNVAGCTKDMVVEVWQLDSVRANGDSAWTVDTVSTIRVCSS